MLSQEIKELFEKVTDAYVSAEQTAIECNQPLIGFDDSEELEEQEEEFKYQMSRVFTKVEEWNSELDKLLNA